MERPHLALLLTLLPTLNAQNPTAQAGPTLEQILGSPLPSSLIAAPVKSRIAWVLNERGTYSIWVGEGESTDEYRDRRLHTFPGDTGRVVTLISFTHDGDNIVFQRGGSFNPTSRASGAPGTAVFKIPFAGGEPIRLGDANAGAVSPTRSVMAFAKGGEVFLQSLTEDAKKKTFAKTRIVKTRGRVSQLRWSRDGTRLAMCITRKSFDATYSWIAVLHTGKLSYLDPSIHQDTDPRWSPDGRRIAFIRRTAPHDDFVLTARTFPKADPWDIRVANVATGATASWLPRLEPHSYHHADVQWRTDDRLVYRSERSGWHRLYEVTAKRRPRPLSPADSEAGELAIGPHGVVLFTSNAFDEDRRHIWRAELDEPARLWTRGPSIEWSPTPLPGSDIVAHFGSDARHPALAAIRSLDRRVSRPLGLAAMPKDFPADQLVHPDPVVFHTRDGQRIHAQLFKPPAEFKGRRPAVLFFHGGPMRQMLLGWHHRGYYHRAYGFNQYLATKGYCVLSVNFRLGIGYGREFRDVADGGPRGASEYHDLLAANRWLRRQAFVDPERIGLWGGSYGGFMAALGLARNSDLFAAGVDFHGVHDWNLWQSWVKKDAVKAENATAHQSSPRASLDTWRSPVLLVHGDDDRNVPFAETIWLARELGKRKVDCELLILPDEVHSFLRHASWLKACNAAADFLDRKLRDKATAHVSIRPGPWRYEFDLGEETIEVFTYKPKSYRRDRMIMVMHGTLRNADDYRDHARAMAERFGALIIAPRFDRRRFPARRYHRGGILRSDGRAAPESDWTYKAIPRIAEMVREMEGEPKLPLWIIGHSAGGQFVARMSAFQDTGAVRHVAANPGTHLFPQRDMPFGYGFGDLPRELSDDAAMQRYLAAPLTVYLGTADDKPDRYLNTSPLAKWQGAGRLQRGRKCFHTARKLAEKNGWRFNWRLVEAPGVGHDHEKMFNHAACREALFGK